MIQVSQIVMIGLFLNDRDLRGSWQVNFFIWWLHEKVFYNCTLLMLMIDNEFSFVDEKVLYFY